MRKIRQISCIGCEKIILITDSRIEYCPNCKIRKNLIYQREYQKNNKEKIKKQRKDYYLKNKDDIIKKNREYYFKHKKERIDYREEWRLRNKEKQAKYRRNQYQKNPEIGKKQVKRQKIFRQNNPEEFARRRKIRLMKRPYLKIKANLNSSIRLKLRKYLLTKKNKTFELIGCGTDELKIHLESKFKEGMNWDNYGKWHIDHILPCASFDLTKDEELRKCYNYENLQPLWAEENLKKSNKILKKY